MRAAYLMLVGSGLTVCHRVEQPGRESTSGGFDWSGPVGSGKPFLISTSSGDLLLTWFESRPGSTHALRIASRDQGTWSEPRTVAESPRFFVNWADFPSAVETSQGAWVVHWLEKAGPKPHAYHVRLSASRDRGRTWSAPITAHADRSNAEHGFVAMLPTADGSVAVAWLDGAEMAADTAGTMAVRSAIFQPGGSMVGETVIDRRTCECCQVAMTRTGAGLVVAYRDRSTEEIRDIAVARELGGRWMPPTLVARDGWVWKACPVNGPSIASVDQTVAVAWFTAANGTLRVNAAFSNDGAVSFGSPVRVDEGSPLGRVHLQLVDSRTALVVWLETKGDEAEWRVRRITNGGSSSNGTAVTIAKATRSRDAGFPRTAVSNDNLFVAWTERASPDSGRVRVKRIPIVEIR